MVRRVVHLAKVRQTEDLGIEQTNCLNKGNFNLRLNRISKKSLIESSYIQDTMPRTINAEVLHDYLSSAHMTVMLCRAHGENFLLNPEEIADAKWRIELHIAELEGLRADLTARNVSPVLENDRKIIKMPVAAR